MAELLRMEGITKQFGAVYANKDINLSIEEGEIHTLLGENGAGKSTLIKTMLDFSYPDAGSITLLGKDSHQEAVCLKEDIGIVLDTISLPRLCTAKDCNRI